jgi:hypothetical protein
MGDDPKGAIFVRLKHSVQLLASSPAVQLQLLPEYVCRADELALEFDHWREVAVHNYRDNFSKDQLSALTRLDEKLDRLTIEGREHWTDDAVRLSPEWQSIRCLALRVLEVFGWPVEAPPSYAHEYKSADKVRRHIIN